jgi:hypothetical protein
LASVTKICHYSTIRRGGVIKKSFMRKEGKTERKAIIDCHPVIDSLWHKTLFFSLTIRPIFHGDLVGAAGRRDRQAGEREKRF